VVSEEPSSSGRYHVEILTAPASFSVLLSAEIKPGLNIASFPVLQPTHVKKSMETQPEVGVPPRIHMHLQSSPLIILVFEHSDLHGTM